MGSYYHYYALEEKKRPIALDQKVPASQLVNAT